MFLPLSLISMFLFVFFVLVVMVVTGEWQAQQSTKSMLDQRERLNALHQVALSAVEMFVVQDLDHELSRTMTLEELAVRRQLREVPAYDLHWKMRENVLTYERRASVNTAVQLPGDLDVPRRRRADASGVIA